MIVRLIGQVIERDADRLVVNCQGVGYEVFVPESVAMEFGDLHREVDLYVRQVMRESDITLYGFANRQQRRLFDLLREVKGCGSKTSLAILSNLGESGVVDAISIQDAKLMSRPPGVGPRLAERIIVDLKDKVADLEIDRRVSKAVIQNGKPAVEDELVEALLALGYRRSEIEPAAEAAREQSDIVEDQVKLALRRLAK